MKIGTKILWLGVLIGALCLFSCKKPEAPKAKVIVLNRIDENKPVENALVTVFANAPNGQVDPFTGGEKITTGTTNALGEVKFEFPVENILSVRAEIPINNGDTLFGMGVLRLEENSTYEETVYLSQYKSEL